MSPMVSRTHAQTFYSSISPRSVAVDISSQVFYFSVTVMRDHSCVMCRLSRREGYLHVPRGVEASNYNKEGDIVEREGGRR